MKVDPDEALLRFLKARDRSERMAEDAVAAAEVIPPMVEALFEAVVAASDLIEHLARGGYPPDWPTRMAEVK